MTFDEYSKVIFGETSLTKEQIETNYKYSSPFAPATNIVHKFTGVFSSKLRWSDISMKEYEELKKITDQYKEYRLKVILMEFKKQKLEEDFV